METLIKKLTKEDLKNYTKHFIEWLNNKKEYRTYYDIKLKDAYGQYKEKMIMELYILNDKVIIKTDNYKLTKSYNSFWNNIDALFDLNEYTDSY